MRLIVIISLLFSFITFASPSYAANCDGLQVSGALSTGTYTLTDDCDISGTLTVAGGETVTINGDGFTIDGGGSNGIFDVSSGGTLNVNNVTLTNGFVNGAGGAIYNGGTMMITNSTFSGNTANYGGAINNTGTLTITNSTFSGNDAAVNGGAINNYNTGTSLTITNSTFSGNAADYGGAILNGGTVTITDSTFSGNSASITSGAIYNGGMGTISNSTFSGNTSNVGGVIYNYTMMTITNSTFSGNTANYGGVIDNINIITITNSTFSGNTANYGSAIRSADTVTITNSTFSGNTAPNNGGTIYSTGTVTISNSIISGNTTTNCYGNITNTGASIEDGTSCGFSINDDPMLGTFNGSYFPLLDGSPAIDAALDCAGLTTDQIGTSRPQGSACDIGAIEMLQVIDPDTGEPEIVQPVTAAPPMCNTISDVSASGLPDGVYCRVLMRNGAWMTDAGTVPANLAQANPILAVDVFRITGQSITSDDFGGYVQICLPGTGRLIFLDAKTSPRAEVEITPVEFINGSTCGWIPNAGTLVLIPQ